MFFVLHNKYVVKHSILDKMYRSIRLFSQRGSAFVRRPAVRNFSADANAARGQQNAKHPEFDFKQLEKEITRLIQEVRDSLADDKDDKKKVR